MSIYKHPKTGIYWTRWQHKNVEYRRSTKTRDKEAAFVESRRVRVEVEKNNPDRGPFALEDLAIVDIDSTISRGVTKQYETSLEGYWAIVLRNLWAGVAVSDITYEAVTTYISKRRAAGVRGQSIIREVQCLRRAVAIATRQGATPRIIDWPKVKRDPQLAAQTGKLWSKEQVRVFLKELHEDARDEVLFAALTGLRSAEIKRVRPEWIHETPQGWVLVMAAHATKSRTERVVSLPSVAMEIVRRRTKRNPREPLVFSQASHRKARANASANLKFAHVVTLRDMRHTFASLAMLGSGDLVAVQRALGHRDLKVTERYLSSTLERVHGVGNAAQAALGRITKAGSPKKEAARKAAKSLKYMERETRLELATSCLGSTSPKAKYAKLLDIGSQRSPVIPAVCGEIPDHQAGSPPVRITKVRK